MASKQLLFLPHVKVLVQFLFKYQFIILLHFFPLSFILKDSWPFLLIIVEFGNWLKVRVIMQVIFKLVTFDNYWHLIVIDNYDMTSGISQVVAGKQLYMKSLFILGFIKTGLPTWIQPYCPSHLNIYDKRYTLECWHL